MLSVAFKPLDGQESSTLPTELMCFHWAIASISKYACITDISDQSISLLTLAVG